MTLQRAKLLMCLTFLSVAGTFAANRFAAREVYAQAKTAAQEADILQEIAGYRSWHRVNTEPLRVFNSSIAG